MTTLNQLIEGTDKVVAGTSTKVAAMTDKVGWDLKPQPELEIVEVHAWVKSSTGDGDYSVNLTFTDVEGEKPSASKTPVTVSCSCPAYTHHFHKANFTAMAHIGEAPPPPKVYTAAELAARKPSNRKPTNPHGIPGLCKHLLYVSRELGAANVVTP